MVDHGYQMLKSVDKKYSVFCQPRRRGMEQFTLTWYGRDVTYCNNVSCRNKKCVRNPHRIRESDDVVFLMNLNGTRYCPVKWRRSMRKLREMIFRWRSNFLRYRSLRRYCCPTGQQSKISTSEAIGTRDHRNWKDTRQKRKAYERALRDWRGW